MIYQQNYQFVDKMRELQHSCRSLSSSYKLSH